MRHQNEQKRKELIEWQKQNEQSYDFRKYNNRYITRIIEEDIEHKAIEDEKEEYKKSLHK